MVKVKETIAYFGELFQGSPSTPKAPWSLLNIPPDSVRYSLKYQGAKMGKSHIKDLIDSGSPDVAFYLYAKTFRSNEFGLETFLNRHVSAHLENATATSSILQDDLANLDPNVTVDGAKLGQLFRQGIDWWRQQFRETAKRFARKQPIYILSTPLVGFDAIINASKDAGNAPFWLTRVDWHNEPSRLYHGYEVNLQTKERPVTLLPKTRRPPRDGTIIDDTDRGEANDFTKAFSYLNPEERPTHTYASDRATNNW